jgi:methionine-gamma-lyase
MAAITALFLHQLKGGDELVISDVAYAGAVELARDLLPRFGVDVTSVNTADLDEVEKAISPRTKLIYIETPSNPIIRLSDIAAVAELARSVGARLAVDSTFATPVATRPIVLGADYVIHSLTKYLSGHGDALGGALLGPTDELMALRQRLLTRTGGIISPFNAWLTMRGIATLPLRMEAHQDGAMQVARFLEEHPKVVKVSYPGLPSHPQHELARKQMDNFSGMLAFQVGDGRRAARVLSERLKVWHYAVSLGHHRSLLFYMPTEDMLANSFKLDSRQEAAYRDFAGEGIFRVSVGIEDGDDLCEDLGQALAGL